jgi:hypothetical protein
MQYVYLHKTRKHRGRPMFYRDGGRYTITLEQAFIVDTRALAIEKIHELGCANETLLTLEEARLLVLMSEGVRRHQARCKEVGDALLPDA